MAFFFFKERERLAASAVRGFTQEKNDQSGVAMGERINETSNWSKYVRVVALI